MSDEFGFDLTHDQWDTLKALRDPLSHGRVLTRHRLEALVKLGLASTEHGSPTMTPLGRRVLVRGSCRLLDLAA